MYSIYRIFKVMFVSRYDVYLYTIHVQCIIIIIIQIQYMYM